MRIFGLPRFDPEAMALVHGGRSYALADIVGCGRGLAWRILPTLTVDTADGGHAEFVSPAGSRSSAEEAIERTLVSLLSAASVYWMARIRAELEDGGVFSLAGVELDRDGGISRGGSAHSLATGAFSHEIEGEILRLRFNVGGRVSTLEWKPGLARDALISILYDMKARSPRREKTAAELRARARERNGAVIRELACLFVGSRQGGLVKLKDFLRRRGIPFDINAAILEGADRLIIQKQYIQRLFENIIAYNERTRNPDQSYQLFVDFIRLAEHGGELSAKQLFALYEIGLYLNHSMPRIGEIIASVLRKVAPATEKPPADDRASDAFTENMFKGDWWKPEEKPAEPAGEKAGSQDRRQPPPAAPHPVFGKTLLLLGLDRMPDEAGLKAAWKRMLKLSHPDVIGKDASPEQKEAANQRTSEINIAYALLSKEILSHRR